MFGEKPYKLIAMSVELYYVTGRHLNDVNKPDIFHILRYLKYNTLKLHCAPNIPIIIKYTVTTVS